MNKLMAPSSSNVEMMRAEKVLGKKCCVRVCSSLLMRLLVTVLCQH
jgi:hypothetical protein